MSKQQIDWDSANRIAAAVRDELAPACELIEVAGSIRRHQRTIGDIEIVMIPKLGALFPDAGDRSLAGTQLEDTLRRLEHEGRFKGVLTGGDKHRRYELARAGDMQLDLYMTTLECWPVIFAIRTGSAQFSKALVTTRDKGGFLPHGHQVREGRVYGPKGRPIELDLEMEFLELTVGKWVDPKDRCQTGTWKGRPIFGRASVHQEDRTDAARKQGT